MTGPETSMPPVPPLDWSAGLAHNAALAAVGGLPACEVGTSPLLRRASRLECGLCQTPEPVDAMWPHHTEPGEHIVYCPGCVRARRYTGAV